MAKKKRAKKVTTPPRIQRHLTHDQFRQGGSISLFLGDFESEEELDTYLSEAFPVDFGFVINDRDAPETNVSDDPDCPVLDLLKGFSDSSRFAVILAKSLAKEGWHRSQAAVVFYNFCYDPAKYPLLNNWGKLAFMGTYFLDTKAWSPWVSS